jgi:hypothetical protein
MVLIGYNTPLGQFAEERDCGFGEVAFCRGAQPARAGVALAQLTES